MKKLTKKFITILMSLLICIGIGATAVFADEDRGTNVSATVNQSYVWEMTPTLTNAAGSIEVKVIDNTIAYGNKLVITYKGNNDKDGKHYLVDKSDAGKAADNKLEYTITGFVPDKDGTALIVPAGTTEANLLKNTLTVALKDTATMSGTYYDYLTFTLEIVDPKVASGPVASEPKTGNFLTFSSDGEFTLGLFCCAATGLQVSTDAEDWTAFNGSSDPVTAIQNGDKFYVYLRGDGMTQLSTSHGNVTNLTISPTTAGTLVDCSGNIMTLLDYDNADKVDMGMYCFDCLFWNCSALASAPELPAMKLNYYCYNALFMNCTSLKTAPYLPATTLAYTCYDMMFKGCTSLTARAEVPAGVTIDDQHGNNMYADTNLN